MEKRKVSVGYFETTDEMRELVEGVLDTGRISYGPLCRELEDRFAEIHGVKHAVLAASGTDALRAGLHALKIYHDWADGDGVVVPATTFVATANIVDQVDLYPVFVDVDPLHFCLDPTKIEEAIEYDGNVVAVMPVNLLGQPAQLEAVRTICYRHGLAMMEDSAEAMFVKHRGGYVGSWGDISGFSLYMAHLVTAGVGGIITTDSYDLAEISRSLLNHGRASAYMSIDDDDDLDDKMLEKLVVQRFRFDYPGYSSRMTELQAALALPQLDNWEQMVNQRRAVAGWLTAGLSKHADRLQLPSELEAGQHSYMMYGIKMLNGVDKMPLVMHLETNGVETRDILPLVNQPVFNRWRDLDPEKHYPVSWDLIKTGFYIGCHQGMTKEDADYVCALVDEYFKEHE